MAAAGTPLYDTIGLGYQAHRRADPRIAELISGALGGATSVVNVGAGAGSYEPTRLRVVAVEPSTTMICQRPAGAAPAVRGSASDLPFPDRTFDASLAILTLHHWPSWRAGVREMARVTKERVILLTWDPAASGFWLCDYLPEIMDIDRGLFPTMSELDDEIGPVTVTPVPIFHDCTDGFMCAYWRRPDAYLDPDVRRAISTFAKLGDVEPALAPLRADLESGAWARRHADILAQDSLDLGYRLVVGTPR